MTKSLNSPNVSGNDLQENLSVLEDEPFDTDQNPSKPHDEASKSVPAAMSKRSLATKNSRPTTPAAPQGSSKRTTPTTNKRTPRQRNPVVLLQDQYSQIYATANNRKMKSRSKSISGSDIPPSSSESFSKKRKINSNSFAASTSPAQPSISMFFPRRSKRTPPTYRWVGNGISVPDGSTRYNQLEVKVGNHASLISTGDVVLLSSGDVEEEKLYNTNNDLSAAPANIASLTAVSKKMNRESNAEGNSLRRDGDRNLEEDTLFGNDGDRNITESALRCSDNDIAMNSLDPFVALVEEMWEDPPTKMTRKAPRNDGSNGNQDGSDTILYSDERRTRMKIRARWFFKREDIAGLGGEFTGVSRGDLVSSLTPRDLVLGDQSDENEVSTVLGKCRVLRRRPETKGGPGTIYSNLSEVVKAPKGAFFCRYEINIETPPPRSNGQGKVNVIPYDGTDEEDEILLEKIQTNKERNPKKKGRNYAFDESDSQESKMSFAQRNNKGISSISHEHITPTSSRKENETLSDLSIQDKEEDLCGNSEDAGESVQYSGDNKIYEKDGTNNFLLSDEDIGGSDESSSGDSQKQNDNMTTRKPPTAEGSTTLGKIHVGINHQASIPPVVNKRKYISPRPEVPSLVWRPNCISDAKLESYLSDAGKILKKYMRETYDMEATEINPGTSNCSYRSHVNGQGSRLHSFGTKRQLLSRECNIDAILALLHEHSYNFSAALNTILKSPAFYLYVWTKEEKEQFNTGFQRHFSSLRLVSKGMGPSKDHKDVVDYHYRFKIPDQFKRYQDKKRDQARRMMLCVENRRTEEMLIDGSDDLSNGTGRGSMGMNNGSYGPRKVRNWSSNGGGGSNAIGAAEHRRLVAKDFLIHVRDTIGTDKYLCLVTHLKGYHSRTLSIPGLKEGVTDILQNHQDLLDRFLAFLPKKFRN